MTQVQKTIYVTNDPPRRDLSNLSTAVVSVTDGVCQIIVNRQMIINRPVSSSLKSGVSIGAVEALEAMELVHRAAGVTTVPDNPQLDVMVKLARRVVELHDDGVLQICGPRDSVTIERLREALENVIGPQLWV